MKNKCGLTLSSVLLSLLIAASSVFLSAVLTAQAGAVEVAPRISDKEIVERLTRVEEGIKAIQQQIADTNKRIDDTSRSTNRRIDDLKESNNARFDDMNRRFDILQWMFGLFITISIIILGFVLRMQWQMNKKQTQIEASLETQKDEISFLKTLIEKLLPRGAM
ncbi:MAG: hypothetical protein HY096_02845 [Nitrospinae bacterium]|nr:hypothetical protein [Nitrospinota bacterium]